MKLQRTYRLVRAFLLIGVLSSGFETYAAAHSQHVKSGVVRTVDYNAKSFTIIPDKATNAWTLFWNKNTSFRQKSPKPGANWISRLFSLGDKTTSDSLQPGRRVSVYYRKEYGRDVSRWVTILMPAPTPSLPKG